MASSALPRPELLVLGCSQTKRSLSEQTPAILRYDGPLFRVLRSFLRDFPWPESLSIAVLSARYGLIGGLAATENYDMRMTTAKAHGMRDRVTQELKKLLVHHESADLFMGRDYLKAIDLDAFGDRRRHIRFIEGGIGQKLHQLHRRLRTLAAAGGRTVLPLPRLGRPLYFLPDWDDFVDLDYDFKKDSFSGARRQDRREAHSIQVLRPHRLCDGILVSLAQHQGTKGLLKRTTAVKPEALAPRQVREHFGLRVSQWAFGDCGAFSYAALEKPPISIEQAVELYELYGFDLGASVDHMPLREIRQNGKRVQLTEDERLRRVELTRKNAEEFLRLARQKAVRFLPVGILQGLDAANYASQVSDYLDMGYRHLALGSLVPRQDEEVLSIVDQVTSELRRLRKRPWLHLMGIFRPNLQASFRRLGVDSFDSATYFRKAWLRSDQNYLSVKGDWYAAIRVPPTHDPRTLKRLRSSGQDLTKILHLEETALRALRDFDRGSVSLEACLQAVTAYDSLLVRGDNQDDRHELAYRRTLAARPWKSCPCKLCQELGIEIVIFRGLNRNKRRGAHNTWRLFSTIS